MATYGGMPQIDFSTLGDLGKTYRDSRLQAGRERSLAALGQGASVADVSKLLFQSGDVEGGLSLARLADAQAQRALAQSNSERDFEFRQAEARRAQENANRSHQFSVSQANKPQIVGTPESGYYAINPNAYGGAAAANAPPSGAPSGPQPIIPPSKNTSIGAQVEERRRAAMAQGLDPNDPQTRAYILTGKMPREDQQPLTATDKKAILDADEGVMAAESAIDSLNQAKKLSKQAYEGVTAGARSFVGKQFGFEGATNTAELNNIVMTNALSQLKSIFGAAPTEGERKILLEIQGSVNEPDAVRQKIYDRATVLANRRLEFNRQRVNELRGGTFYKPEGARTPSGKTQERATDQPSAAPPAGAVSALRQNPRLAEEFDAKYGVGAAARALGAMR